MQRKYSITSQAPEIPYFGKEPALELESVSIEDDSHEDSTHCPSIDSTDTDSDSSTDSIPKFTSLKANRISMSYKFKTALLSPPRDQWNAATK